MDATFPLKHHGSHARSLSVFEVLSPSDQNLEQTMFSDTLVSRIGKIEKQLVLIEKHFGQGMWQAIDAAYDISLLHRKIKCIVCEYEGRRADFHTATDMCIFGGGKLERYVCPSCDCVFGPIKYLDLNDELVSTDYQLLYSRYSEADSTTNETRTFRSLGPNKDGIFLDWGCGGTWSKTVTTLRDQGFDVWGYEPSIEMTSGHIVKDKAEISTLFDGIFSNNVIEHFREPLSQFREFYGMLKPGAKMAHSSPCYEYRYPFTRFHSLFLLGNSPHVLADRTGFRVTDVIKDSEDEYINYVFQKV